MVPMRNGTRTPTLAASTTGRTTASLQQSPQRSRRRAHSIFCSRSSKTVLALALLLLANGRASAQGILTAPVILRTGEGLSSTQLIGNFDASTPAWVNFTFGFATDEEVLPGTFLDSLTLTLGEVDGLLSIIYNVTDRSGSYWVPGAPGTISLPESTILREAISFPAIPELDPIYTYRYAFSVTAPVPDELLGRNLNFYADLFDNGNGVNSLGWISITPVPEPSTWALGLAAVAMFFTFKRKK
jgi:hypothetical protein